MIYNGLGVLCREDGSENIWAQGTVFSLDLCVGLLSAVQHNSTELSGMSRGDKWTKEGKCTYCWSYASSLAQCGRYDRAVGHSAKTFVFKS